MRVDQLTPLHLETLYAAVQARGLSGWSCRHVHTVVSAMLTAAARWRLCPADHAAKQAKAPPEPKATKPRAPSVDDVQALLAGAADRSVLLGLFVRLDAVMAGRRGEVAALRWSDFDLDAAQVTPEMCVREFDRVDRQARHAAGITGRAASLEVAPISKSNESAAIDIGPVTAELVRRIRSEQQVACAAVNARAGTTLAITDADHVFRTDLTEALPDTPATWSTRFAALKADLGIVMRMHDLRHFVATAVADEHGIHKAQEVLRHSRVTTTARYAKKNAGGTGALMERLLDPAAPQPSPRPLPPPAPLPPPLPTSGSDTAEADEGGGTVVAFAELRARRARRSGITA